MYIEINDVYYKSICRKYLDYYKKCKSKIDKSVKLNFYEEKIEDEEARKQREMMKKFYRNRYSSFLQAIAAKKAEEAKKEEADKLKKEKLKEKLKEKVLG